MGPSSLAAPDEQLLGAGTGSPGVNWAGGDGIPGGRCLAAFELHLVVVDGSRLWWDIQSGYSSPVNCSGWNWGL